MVSPVLLQYFRELWKQYLNIPCASVYFDDILITGANDVEHLINLGRVLSKLKETGLLLNKDKCLFMSSSVTFLGHRIDAEGLHPMSDKVQAVLQAPRPHNITQLKSFLGLLSYYSKFIPNMATLLSPTKF